MVQSHHLILLVVFCAFFSRVNGADHPNVSASSFCYDGPDCGPEHWKGVCNTGKQQSPINIHVPTRFKWTEFEMNDHYLSERKHQFFAQNNGHTAQFELTQNTSALHSDLRVCGGGLKACYQFAQFHFHWDETDVDGSEHTLNGERFPMELHIVHYKDKFFSLANALESGERDAVAVMAVLFQISELDNLKLESIVMALESLRVPGDVQEFHLPLTISSFYPKSKEFARYLGSLTTPTCDEKVIWTVFLRPIEISEDQMHKFRRLRNEEGVSDFNFRSLQPLNDRTITFYMTGEFRNTV